MKRLVCTQSRVARIIGAEPDLRRLHRGETLSRIAHELPVDAIVLVGTDRALVYDESNTDFPHVDCVRAHVRSILDALA